MFLLCFYRSRGPYIIYHIHIQNQWRRPQNYPECQPSGAAILNARTSTDVIKYCKNDFRRLKKKVSSAFRDDLQHQKLKLYLHYTKKSLEVIRINFVEIPWLVSLLKTRVLTLPYVISTASRDNLQLTRDWTSLAFDRETPDSRYELSRNTF